MPKSLRSPGHQALIAVLTGARRAARLSQESLAKKMGWSQSEISRVERGERRLDVIEFTIWARALNQDPIKLYTRFVQW